MGGRGQKHLTRRQDLKRKGRREGSKASPSPSSLPPRLTSPSTTLTHVIRIFSLLHNLPHKDRKPTTHRLPPHKCRDNFSMDLLPFRVLLQEEEGGCGREGKRGGGGNKEFIIILHAHSSQRPFGRSFQIFRHGR